MPNKVKKQIWVNECVDFALLLNRSLTQSNDHYTLRVDQGEGGKPALIPASNPKWQTVQSIEQWVSALQVFVAIYSEKAPHDTSALIKYGSVIRELASQGANWKFYDKNFPSIRQIQGAPWDLPFRDSVNDFIPPEFRSVQYARFDDTIRIIKLLGEGCTLSKVGVRSRLLARRPSSRPKDGHFSEMEDFRRPVLGGHL